MQDYNYKYYIPFLLIDPPKSYKQSRQLKCRHVKQVSLCYLQCTIIATSHYSYTYATV